LVAEHKTGRYKTKKDPGDYPRNFELMMANLSRGKRTTRIVPSAAARNENLAT
jgi:hypothetical protein